MLLINSLLITVGIAFLIIPIIKLKAQAVVVFATTLLVAIVSSIPAIKSLTGESLQIILQGNPIFGDIPLKMDALSGWFVLLINFTFITGCIYGIYYMRSYQEQRNNLSLHAINFIILHVSIVSLCVIQNSLLFLIAWELMALSAFLSLIFDHNKQSTIKAGLNYLIQSHVSIIFLMIGFIWVAVQTGSYDFAAIRAYSFTHSEAISTVIFLLFFTGFAIKAGFVPFHTWLPYAHPAAPSHISGIMSGVLIKIGIYGILRMLLILHINYTTIGIFILSVSIISGLYGVMLAILQHNLKKLLAYHSIENIGIIGIGIGAGCIGLGTNSLTLSVLGFSGALLHTLNHSLFKSLLFYAAGNVYQATHSLDIEKLGGLVKKMPQTTILFLIAALAISGLPPFNGFISEFLIYSGFINSFNGVGIFNLVWILLSIIALVLIGGLALMCFTKAFGVVFLGNSRSEFSTEITERPFLQLLPMYMISIFIIFIGLYPQLFLNILSMPVALFHINGRLPILEISTSQIAILNSVSYGSWGFIVVILLIFLIRRQITNKKQVVVATTWGCGYNAPIHKAQYTASSFVKNYSLLLGPFFLIHKKQKNVVGIFPAESNFETHPYDKLEKWLIDIPISRFTSFLDQFRFFQNGKLQFYILYGIVFISLIVSIPFVYRYLLVLLNFLKNL